MPEVTLNVGRRCRARPRPCSSLATGPHHEDRLRPSLAGLTGSARTASGSCTMICTASLMAQWRWQRTRRPPTQPVVHDL